MDGGNGKVGMAPACRQFLGPWSDPPNTDHQRSISLTAVLNMSVIAINFSRAKTLKPS